jgi:hypothetical protein
MEAGMKQGRRGAKQDSQEVGKEGLEGRKERRKERTRKTPIVFRPVSRLAADDHVDWLTTTPPQSSAAKRETGRKTIGVFLVLSFLLSFLPSSPSFPTSWLSCFAPRLPCFIPASILPSILPSKEGRMEGRMEGKME